MDEKEGEILQEEKIEVTDPVTDEETGELAPETKVVITPEVEAPAQVETTLGDLQAKLDGFRDSKKASDERYAADSKYLDDNINTLQAQIDQIKKG